MLDPSSSPSATDPRRIGSPGWLVRPFGLFVPLFRHGPLDFTEGTSRPFVLWQGYFLQSSVRLRSGTKLRTFESTGIRLKRSSNLIRLRARSSVRWKSIGLVPSAVARHSPPMWSRCAGSMHTNLKI